MPIEFLCSECGTMLRVDDANRGKMARCPKCGMINPIPGETVTPVPEKPSLELPDTTYLPAEKLWSMRGVDGSIYGPIPWAEILRWQREGRINHQCSLQKVGDTEWSPALDVLLARKTSEAKPTKEPIGTAPDIRYQGDVARTYQPHNGVLILVLACIGIGIYPCAIVAAIMGHLELQKIRRGLVDPQGQSLVQAGYAVGLTFSILGILPWICCCCVPSIQQRF